MHRKWLIIVLMVTILVLLVGVVPTSAAPSEYGVVHVVRRGETLYSIARRYGVGVWTLAQANGITNPNRIYIGQRLVIPGGQPPSQPSGSVHVVRRGETLYSIARRYGVDVWTLARANAITNVNYIYVGQRLTIPGVGPPPPPPPSPPPPVQPGAFPGPWHGEYFNNTTLTAPACVTRTDGSVNFNWGWGVPETGVPKDYFSTRWTGDFNFPGGTYRFYARVDDGVRVYVDGERIINGWRDGSVRRYTADRALAAGDHTVQVEYYERIQVARIHFWWEKIGGPAPAPTPLPGTGWIGQFYNNTDLQEPPFATRHDSWIEFDWGTGSPVPGMRSDYFSVRWTATEHLNTDTYRFCARSDDGVRLWVDGERVLDEWHPSSGALYCGKHWVKSGNHEIKVEYYERDGDALITVWWEPY